MLGCFSLMLNMLWYLLVVVFCGCMVLLFGVVIISDFSCSGMWLK